MFMQPDVYGISGMSVELHLLIFFKIFEKMSFDEEIQIVEY
jgi:hypothetical protein